MLRLSNDERDDNFDDEIDTDLLLQGINDQQYTLIFHSSDGLLSIDYSGTEEEIRYILKRKGFAALVSLGIGTYLTVMNMCSEYNLYNFDPRSHYKFQTQLVLFNLAAVSYLYIAYQSRGFISNYWSSFFKRRERIDGEIGAGITVIPHSPPPSPFL